MSKEINIAYYGSMFSNKQASLEQMEGTIDNFVDCGNGKGMSRQGTRLNFFLDCDK